MQVFGEIYFDGTKKAIALGNSVLAFSVFQRKCDAVWFWYYWI
jgi:hypothetical protein